MSLAEKLRFSRVLSFFVSRFFTSVLEPVFTPLFRSFLKHDLLFSFGFLSSRSRFWPLFRRVLHRTFSFIFDVGYTPLSLESARSLRSRPLSRFRFV